MTSPPSNPPLSIVVASRNDGHGGNLLRRMRTFLDGLLDQCRAYRVPAELVVVEWNPPPDRPGLCDVLPTPSADDWLTLRYIVVPGAIHRRYRRAPDLPMFQMIAKNVGIRRARGAFVLCTNVDLLFSDALFRRLAGGALRADTYYRANRCDVPDNLAPDGDLAERLAWCERNVIRRIGRDPRCRHINLEAIGMQGRSNVKNRIVDTLALGLRPFWSREKLTFYRLDTFACGDFTLMSQAAWTAIEGYVELDLYSLHVDSLALVAATALGYAQHVFPRDACTYHIEHASGWEGLAPLEKVRFLERWPSIDYSLVPEIAFETLRRGKPFGLNAPDWGYADVVLEEHTFAPGPARAPRPAVDAVHAGA